MSTPIMLHVAPESIIMFSGTFPTSTVVLEVANLSFTVNVYSSELSWSSIDRMFCLERFLVLAAGLDVLHLIAKCPFL